MSTLPPIDLLIAKVRAAGFELPPGIVRTDGYGDTPELSQELIELVRRGEKTGGTSLRWGMEIRGEEVPSAGDLEIVIDHLGEPALVVRFTRVEVLPFDQVGAEFAYTEGEGERTLASWRKDHWSFFSRECKSLGLEPSQSMLCVCTNFEVLHVL